MEILSRVPVKSLLRFRSVCKHWCSLIQNPSFISLHLNSTPKNNDSLLVKRLLDNAPNSEFALSLVPNESPIYDLVAVSSTIGVKVTDLDLLGSCNGVVCIATSCDSTIVLCNPAMREIRVLHQPSYHTRRASKLGFGFDPKSNEYKVVRVATLFEWDLQPFPYDDDGHESYYGVVDVKVEVYNLSTDVWREIHSVVPRGFACNSGPNFRTSLNGDFYWFAKNVVQPDDYAIIAFRMTDESFELIPVPPEVCSQCWFTVYLVTLNDSLALLVSWGWMSNPSITCLDVWVMVEYGGKDSWTKKYTFGPIQGGYYVPLLFRQNGEFLHVRRGGDGRMVSYDLNTEKTKEYQVYNNPGAQYGSLQVLSYTESLVPVKRRIDQDIFVLYNLLLNKVRALLHLHTATEENEGRDGLF